jgi:hypothetical protein
LKRGPKKTSARTLRRSALRAHDKLVAQRRRLAALEPGGTAERRISVPSASVVEVQALGHACLACDERRQQLVEHRAEQMAEKRLRVVDVRCTVCGARRRFFFEIINVEPN